jgi:hypothetical protein
MEEERHEMLDATIIVVAIATSAGAQAPNMLGGGSSKLKANVVDPQQEKERERAYKSAIDKIPDATGKRDPWGNVRSPAAPQPAQSSQRPASR